MGANPSVFQQSTSEQFSLRALFECVTVCGVLAALTPWTGWLASALFIGVHLALTARQGFVALALLVAVSMSCGSTLAHVDPSLLAERAILVLLVGMALIAWQSCRRGVCA